MRDINDIVAKAQQTMVNPDFWKKVDNKANSNRQNNGNNVLSESAINEFDIYSNLDANTDIQMLETTESRNASIEEKIQSSPLLSQIYKDKPPMSGEYREYRENNSSNPMKQLDVKRKEAQQKRINEQQQMIPQQTVINSQIDYNYIKYLIDESIKQHLSNTNLLNESTTPQMVGMKMCEGNKIQFMDSKGNIYEGVLKLKKRKQ